MTYSMVFQSPHGRLNYGFMSLDRDVAYFNFIFYQVYVMLPHDIEKALFHFKFFF